MDTIVRATLIGIGATLLMDGWALLLKRVLAVSSLDYALVGRWLGHMPRGRFVHTPIAAAAKVPGERALGWMAHYAIGILFAWLLVALCGEAWLRRPTVTPALLFGVITVAAPFLIMQPSMGFGIAAARTPKPAVARLRSLATHTVFGVGLYAAAWCLTRLAP